MRKDFQVPGEKVKRPFAEPMSEQEFLETWDSLLRIFLVLSDEEFVHRETFSAPHELLQVGWRVNDTRYV